MDVRADMSDFPWPCLAVGVPMEGRHDASTARAVRGAHGDEVAHLSSAMSIAAYLVEYMCQWKNNTCIYTDICIYTHICIYTCMCMCMCVYANVNEHIHIGLQSILNPTSEF